MKSPSSYLRLFYILVLFSIPFLLSSCELINEQEGAFPPEGHIWVEIENQNYIFSDPSGTIPSFLNTYSGVAKSLSIYRTNNEVMVSNFRVLLTRFDFDDTTPRTLEKLNTRLEFTQGNTAFIASNDKGDANFEILSIENDVIKAIFSGTLENRDNPSQKLRIRNGALNIRIRRE